MTATDDKLLPALKALAAALKTVPARSMIIGGVAVIAHGVPRQTVDIDATIAGPDLELEDLLAALSKQDIHPRIDNAIAFAQQRQILLLRHEPSQTPLDISLAWLPFEEQALARAREFDFGGVRVPIVAAEDLVVYKVIAWRGRDQADIERLVMARHDEIDLNRVRARVREFAEIIEQPERVEEFERLIRRVLEASRSDAGPTDA